MIPKTGGTGFPARPTKFNFRTSWLQNEFLEVLLKVKNGRGKHLRDFRRSHAVGSDCRTIRGRAVAAQGYRRRGKIVP